LVKHFNITVSGKVQGVFFRVYTEKKANEIGLCGFVQNQPNGDVYIEAEGSEEQLSELAQWCKTGSPEANVKDVVASEGELKNFKGKFMINR
jgi:acylphosphatase